MSKLPVSHLTRSGRRPSHLSRFAAFTTDSLRLLGAAIRATRALEARRDPDPADLKTLGIATKLPTAW